MEINRFTAELTKLEWDVIRAAFPGQTYGIPEPADLLACIGPELRPGESLICLRPSINIERFKGLCLVLARDQSKQDLPRPLGIYSPTQPRLQRYLPTLFDVLREGSVQLARGRALSIGLILLVVTMAVFTAAADRGLYSQSSGLQMLIGLALVFAVPMAIGFGLERFTRSSILHKLNLA